MCLLILCVCCKYGLVASCKGSEQRCEKPRYRLDGNYERMPRTIMNFPAENDYLDILKTTLIHLDYALLDLKSRQIKVESR